ncbi:uncharacterized protein LOC133137781 [Conger conger]|uniref:uncharacterized protein LOC133137781 n=1 Tax=Conger conger TaxID=82655 RepID=UPI002A5ACCAD|nr:uncharacterized protein LOC133137781 [Conger conger]
MECPLLIVAVFLSTAPVSRAEEDLFVLKGDSVRLDVKRHEELQFHSISWSVNISKEIVDYIRKRQLIDKYENGIISEFDKKNLSLLLKNVTQNYSGIYTATITDDGGQEKAVATYRLTVQEAPPIPQVSVALLSSDGGVCKVLVNCSAEDTMVSYTCDHAHCTQVENTTSPTGLNLIVTATNDTIHCSSSNRVATKTQSYSTKDICSVPPVAPSPGLSPCALKSVLFSTGLVAMVSAVIAVNVRERCCREK